MGMRTPSSYTTTQANAISGGTTEIVLFQVGALASPQDNATIVFAWFISFTAGTLCTSVGIQIRRGLTITSPLVSAALWTQTTVAGNSYILSGWDNDQPGVAESPYVLTLQQNSGSSASTYVDGCFYAFAL